MSVEDFAQFLSHPAELPGVDRTGIQGDYDFDLRFGATSQPDSDQPDLFTAVQEQLGFRLVSEKVPVEHLVLESAQAVSPVD